jgi:hypothetical protein
MIIKPLELVKEHKYKQMMLEKRAEIKQFLMSTPEGQAALLRKALIQGIINQGNTSLMYQAIGRKLLVFDDLPRWGHQ